jgi:hypothetical protein
VYEGIEGGIARIADAIAAEGPFDGVVGFSQGGCLAGMVASLLEDGRREAFGAASAQDGTKIAYPSSFVRPDGRPIQAPLKFAIAYSGFAAPMKHYSAFYEPRIGTPTMHFLGSLDTVVEEKRSLALVECCQDKRVVTHPGGHLLPSQKVWLDAALMFIQECMSAGKEEKGEVEERVEDMEVPF